MDGSAADTLDRIRDGATHIVATALQRLDEAKEALMAGDFRKAHRRLEEAQNRINPLSSAEVQFAGWDKLRIIRGYEVEEGQKVYNWDTVGEITKTIDDPSGDGDTIIFVIGENGDERKFYGESELIIIAED